MTRDDGTTEHKPMTDAELARLERAYSAENWADSDGPVEARNARALIAEVRRLREEIAYLTRGHDWANAMRVVVDSGTLDADQLERLREHFEKWLRDPEPFYVVRLGDRTLTLPNGTVVRSGDVLVNTHYPFGTGCLRRSVVLVTAVGENTFLGREIAATVGVIKVDVQR